MRQIDVIRSTKLRWIGSVWVIVHTSIALFNVVILAVYLFGWHQLVFYQYIPNFWVFAALLGGSFLFIILAVYKVVIPGQMAFNVNQAWRHDNPIKKKLEELEERLNEVLEKL